jgi:hypothetical protein
MARKGMILSRKKRQLCKRVTLDIPHTLEILIKKLFHISIIGNAVTIASVNINWYLILVTPVVLYVFWTGRN